MILEAVIVLVISIGLICIFWRNRQQHLLVNTAHLEAHTSNNADSKDHVESVVSGAVGSPITQTNVRQRKGTKNTPDDVDEDVADDVADDDPLHSELQSAETADHLNQDAMPNVSVNNCVGRADDSNQDAMMPFDSLPKVNNFVILDLNEYKKLRKKRLKHKQHSHSEDNRLSNMKRTANAQLKEVDQNIYVPTRAYSMAEQLLLDYGIVILIGSPGSGKTTIGYSLMKRLKDLEKRKSLLLTHPSQFEDISRPKDLHVPNTQFEDILRPKDLHVPNTQFEDISRPNDLHVPNTQFEDISRPKDLHVPNTQFEDISRPKDLHVPNTQFEDISRPKDLHVPNTQFEDISRPKDLHVPNTQFEDISGRKDLHVPNTQFEDISRPKDLHVPNTQFEDISGRKDLQKVKPGDKYVIMVDDIYGKSNLVTEFQRSWEMKFETMWPLVESGFVKLIITFRTQIFAECKESLKAFVVFKKRHQIDLHGRDLCLTSEEKRNILERHLKHSRIHMKDLEKETVVQKTFNELGFPQCCKFFVSSSKAQKQGAKYFENPIKYLMCQFNQLKADRSKQCQFQYLVLLIVMFKQGHVKDDCFVPFKKESHDTIRLKDILIDICRISSVSLGQIKASANSLCGLYLEHSVETKEYSFIHQSVFDTLFIQFSKDFQEQGIIICPVPMLLQYVITPGVAKKGDITVMIDNDNYSVLAGRFTDLLRSNSARSILTHQSFKDEQFVEDLTEKFWKSEVPSDVLSQKIDKQEHMIDIVFDEDNVNHIWRYFQRQNGYFPNMNPFQKVFVCQNFIYSSSTTTSVAVMENSRTLSKCFVIELCKLKGSEVETQKKEVFDVSCFMGNAEVTNILLQSGICPTMSSLTAAAVSQIDDKSMFEKLLNHKKDLKLNVHDLGSLLFLAMEKGNGKISSLLVDEISQMESSRPIFERAVKQLLIQCHGAFRNSPILKHKNLKIPSSVTIAAEGLFKQLCRYTCIQTVNLELCASLAAAYDDVGILKEIITMYPACVSITNEGETLLHTASRYGCVDSVDLLLEHGLTITATNKNKQTALHLAAEHNSSDVVTFLLKKGADPNVEDEMKNTPLHLAVRARSLDSVTKLVEFEAKLDSFNALGETPLQYAAKDRSVNFVKYLVEKGSKVNLTSSSGMTPLHLALHYNKADVIQYLVLNDSDLKLPCPVAYAGFQRRPLPVCFDVANFLFNKQVDKSSNLFVVLLHRAVRSGDITAVRFFLEKEVKLDFSDTEGRSAVHVASRLSCVPVLSLLLKHGASVNSFDNDGRYPLHDASVSADVPTIVELLKHRAKPNVKDKDGLTPMHLGVMKDRKEIVETLVSYGADINSQTKNGFTCLYTAVLNETESSAKVLISLNADVNIPDRNGQTALLHAIMFKKDKLVKLLVDANADTNKQDKSMYTPLHYATVLHQPKMILRLLQYNADPYLQNCNGLTCMHHAASLNNFEILQVLLDYKVDPNCISANKQTPIFQACLLNLETNVNILLQNGASAEWRDNNGQTPLHVTALYGHVDLMKRLLDTKVDVDCEDNQQITPLIIACLFGNLEIVNILLENGAKPNHGGELTAMHIAAELDDSDILQSLLDKGGNQSVVADVKNKPFSVAVYSSLRKEQSSLFDSTCSQGAPLFTLLHSVKTLLSTEVSKKVPLLNMKESEIADLTYLKDTFVDMFASREAEQTESASIAGVMDSFMTTLLEKGLFSLMPAENSTNDATEQKPATEDLVEQKEPETQFDLEGLLSLIPPQISTNDATEQNSAIENLVEQKEPGTQFDLEGLLSLIPPQISTNDVTEQKPATEDLVEQKEPETQFDLAGLFSLTPAENSTNDATEKKPATEDLVEQKEPGTQFDLAGLFSLIPAENSTNDATEQKPATENLVEQKEPGTQFDLAGLLSLIPPQNSTNDATEQKSAIENLVEQKEPGTQFDLAGLFSLIPAENSTNDATEQKPATENLVEQKEPGTQFDLAGLFSLIPAENSTNDATEQKPATENLVEQKEPETQFDLAGLFSLIPAENSTNDATEQKPATENLVEQKEPETQFDLAGLFSLIPAENSTNDATEQKPATENLEEQKEPETQFDLAGLFSLTPAENSTNDATEQKPATENLIEQKEPGSQFDLAGLLSLIPPQISNNDATEQKPATEDVADQKEPETQFDVKGPCESSPLKLAQSINALFANASLHVETQLKVKKSVNASLKDAYFNLESMTNMAESSNDPTGSSYYILKSLKERHHSVQNTYEGN